MGKMFFDGPSGNTFIKLFTIYIPNKQNEAMNETWACNPGYIFLRLQILIQYLPPLNC